MMRFIKIAAIFIISLALISRCKSKEVSEDTQAINSPKPFEPTRDMIAKIYTSKGVIEVGLEYVRAPLTVANFVALAEGQMRNVHKPLGKPFYDGLIFHRVIEDFMAQGGCPTGQGFGNAGYQFADEFHEELNHDDAGVLSMANSGPNTNSCQFFITHKSTPWLDRVHSVFGKVIKGMDVLMSIQNQDRIDSIRIVRLSNEAKGFDAVKVFESQKQINEQKAKAAIVEKYASYQNTDLYRFFEEYVKKTYPNALKTESGLYYIKNKESEGVMPIKGNIVKVHYRGKHTNGEVFDESFGKTPFEFKLGAGEVIPGWDEGISLFKKGEKGVLIIPPYLAYGEQGIPQVIKPNEVLVFDIELLGVR